LPEFFRWLSDQDLTRKTIKNYVSDLRHFSKWLHSQNLDLTSLQGGEINNYLAFLAKSGTPRSTVKRRLSSLRKFEQFWQEQIAVSPGQSNLVASQNNQTKSLGNANLVATKPLNVPTSNPGIKSKNPSSLVRERVLAEFEQALIDSDCKENSVKNYLADIGIFSQQYPEGTFNAICTKPKVALYLREMRFQGLAAATVRRRESSLKRFCQWAAQNNIIEENPFSEITENKSEGTLTSTGKNKNLVGTQGTSSQASQNKQPASRLGRIFQTYNQSRIASALHLAILVIFATALGIFGYQQFIRDAAIQLAYPSEPVTPGRILSFQGRVTTTGGTPIGTLVDMQFRLYDSEDDLGTNNLLWESPTCQIDPDVDGVFSTILGQECGGLIDSSVFTENSEVWLEIQVATETLKPRQRIATVAYALNSETLQGFPPSLEGTINTIPVINALGELIIGAENPKLIASTGAFLMQAESMIFTTETGTQGDITFQPATGGTINFLSGTSNQDSIFVSNPNLTSGNLIHGYIGNNTATGNLLYLTSGTPEQEKFAVDAQGNTRIAGSLAVDTSLLFVDKDDQQIGIGTATPGSFFHLTGGLSRFGSAGAIDYISGDGSVYIQNDLEVDGTIYGNLAGTITPTGFDPGGVVFGGTGGALTQNTGQFFWDNSSGRLGIGTTSPTAKLHITGTADQEQLIIKAHSTQNDNLTEWQNSSGTATTIIDPYGRISSTTTSSLSTATQGLYIQNSDSGSGNLMGLGFLNLGTASKTYVTGVSGTNSIRKMYSDGTNTTSVVTGIQAENSSYTDGAARVVNITNANTLLAKQPTWSGSAGATNISNAYGVRIEQHGVPVGSPLATITTTNAYGLYINDQSGATSSNYSIYTNLGNVSFGDDVLLRNDSDHLKLGAGGDLDLYHDGTNSYITNNTGDLYIGDAGTDDVILSSNGGNVGIGTTSPGSKLDVNGNINTNGNINLSGVTADHIISMDVTNDTQGALIFESSNSGTAGSAKISTVEVNSFERKGLGFFTKDTADWTTGATEKMRLSSVGYLGIGTTSPTSLLSVGSASEFQVDSTGNIVSLGGVAHSISDSSGALAVSSAGNLDLSASSNLLLSDSRVSNLALSLNDTALNAALSQAIVDAINDVYGLATGTGGVSGFWQLGSTHNLAPVNESYNLFVGGDASSSAKIALEGATGNLKLRGDNQTLSLGSSDNLSLLFDGSAGKLSSTGDLIFTIDSLAGAGTSQFAIRDGANNDLFVVSESKVSSYLPTEFLSAGDVSLSYDLLLTNQVASSIVSSGPLTIEVGESFESNDLVVKTYNTGGLVLDTPGGVNLSQAQNWSLASSTTALNLGGLLNLDTTNQRVGVGTTAPDYTLDVDGDLNFTGALRAAGSAGTAGQVLLSAGAGTPVWTDISGAIGSNAWLQGGNTFGAIGVLGTNDNYNLQFKTNNATRMTIDTSGNVGIGTTSPSYPLDIVGSSLGTLQLSNVSTDATSKYSSLVQRHYTNSEESFQMLFGQSTSSANNLRIGGGSSNFNAATLLEFYTAANNTTTTGTPRMVINSAGNVGIGTTSPDSRLQVIGGNATIRLQGGPGASGGSHISLGYATLSTADYGSYISQQGDSGEGLTIASYGAGGLGGNITFKTYQSSGSSNVVPRMRITSAGNVGIGTTAPGAKLDVAGAVRLGDAGGTYDILNTSAAGGAASGDLYWGNSALLTSANIGSFGVSRVTNSDGTLNISPTTGDVVASLNLANANTWTAAQDIQLDSSTAFAVRNSGGTGLLAMNTNTGLLSLQGLQSTATLGSELVTNGNFDTDLTGWTYGGGTDWTQSSGAALHTTGNTTPLTQDITTTNGTTYQVTVTTARTAGYVTLTFGDTVGSYNLYSSTYTYTFKANGASETLTFTPSTDFDGTVDSVTVKAITATSSPVLAVNNSDGSVGLELRSGGSGLYNTFVGDDAGAYNTTGYYNSFLGYRAGYSNTTGYYNSFLGYQAGYNNTTGYNNSFLGMQAGFSNTTGYYNSFLGYRAGYSNTTGNYNSFLGMQAGFNNTTGNQNSFLGYRAGFNNTTGYYNSFLGYQAGYSNTTGYNNSFLGTWAGYSNTTGNRNSFLGMQAGRSNTTGNQNSFLGMQAGYSNTTGYNNSFLGYAAGFSNTTGYSNSFLGMQAGYNNTTGYYNSFLGYRAGYSNTTGYSNSFLGYQAGFSNTTGYSNSFLGMQAGYDVTEGLTNTLLGYNTGRGITTGDKNTIIGANVTGLDANLSNNIILADGDGNVRLQVDGSGNVGIGTTAPSDLLHVAGDVRVEGAFKDSSNSAGTSGNVLTSTGTGTSWTALSGLSVGNADTLDSLDSTDFLRATANDTFEAGNTLTIAGTLDVDGNAYFPGGIWNTSGNVGIGTTDPNHKLTITDGNLNITGTGIATAIRIDGTVAFAQAPEGTFPGQGGYTRFSGSGMLFTPGNDNTVRMSLTPTGNLGIGTTSPSQLLDVNGNMRLRGQLYDYNNSVGNPGQLLSTTATGVDWIDASGVGTDDQTLEEVYQSGDNDVTLTAGHGDIRFVNDAATEMLFLDEDTGRVGVGTTTPEVKLDVNMSDDTTYLSSGLAWQAQGYDAAQFRNNSTTNDFTSVIFRNTGSAGNATGRLVLVNRNSGRSDFAFLLRSSEHSTSTDEKMRITHDGNVGIGTTAPGAKLDVNGNILVQGGGSLDTRAAGTLTIGGATQTGLTLGRIGANTTLTGATTTITGNTAVKISNLTTNGVVYTSGGDGALNTEALLSTTRGGTGIGSYATGDLLYASGTNTLAKRTVGSAGQVLTVVGGVPAWADAATASSIPLSSITAATQANSINNGDYAQVWNWSLITTDKAAFTFGENSASTATGTPSILQTSTLASSTAIPLYVKNLGNAASFRVDDEASDTSPFIIDASGNVGIGTTAPTTDLSFGNASAIIGTDTADASDNKSLAFSGGGSASSNRGSYIQAYGNEHASYGGQLWLAAGSNATTGDIQFFTQSTNRLHIDYDGNIGIGTTTPSFGLDVDGTARFTGNVTLDSLAAGATDTVITHASGVLQARTIDSRVWSGGGLVGGTGSAGQVTFWQDASTITGNNSFFWSSAQSRLGIGTTAPSRSLHVEGTSGLFLGTTAKNIQFFTSGTDNDISSSHTLHLNYSNNQHVSIGQGGTSNLLVSGSLGLGTTNPTRRLESVHTTSPQLRLTHTAGTNFTDLQTNSSGALVISPSDSLTRVVGDLVPNIYTWGTPAELYNLGSSSLFWNALYVNAIVPDPNLPLDRQYLEIAGDVRITGGDILGNLGEHRMSFNDALNTTTISHYLGVTRGATISAELASDMPLHLRGAAGQTANYFSITSSGGATGNIFSVLSDGDIGIGTTAPASKLHVVGNSDQPQLIVQANSTQSNTSPLLQLRNSGGTEILRLHTDGYTNLFVGNMAGTNNTTANGTFVGAYAGYNNTTGGSNSFYGFQSGYNTTWGSSNSFFGAGAGFNNTGGGGNVFLGFQAGYQNTNRFDNIFIGYQAGYNSDANSNIFIGRETGQFSQTGTGNVSLGNQSFGKGTGSAFTGADNNTIIGYRAGYNLGSNDSGNVLLGYQAGYNETGSNKLYIANSNAAFPLIYGDFSTAELGINGNLGIGTTNPSSRLTVSGGSIYQSDSSGGVNAYTYVARRSVGLLGYPDIYGSSGGLVLADTTSANTQISLNSNILLSGGNVGIGTTAPAAKLDVSGSATVSGTLAVGVMNQVDAGTCNAASEGEMYYDKAEKQYKYCNGTDWAPFGVGLYSESSTIDAGSYLEIEHNLNTTDVVATVWDTLSLAEVTTTSQGQLPDQLKDVAAASATINGTTYLYVSGGHDGSSPVSTVYRATVDSNGNVGTWSTTNQGQLPAARNRHTMVIGEVNGNYYAWVAGGQGAGGGTSVLKAPIDSSGNIGTWTSSGQTQLYANLYWHSMVFYTVNGNDYIYSIGGYNNSTGTATTIVRRGTLDSSGNITEWLGTGQTNLPASRYNHQTRIAEVDGTIHLYLTGGSGSNRTWKSVIDGTTGNVGTWDSNTNNQSSFSTNLEAHTMEVALSGDNAKLFVLGGNRGGTTSDTVERGNLASNGNVVSWNENNQFPLPSAVKNSNSTAVTISGKTYFYNIGGLDTSDNVVDYVMKATVGSVKVNDSDYFLSILDNNTVRLYNLSGAPMFAKVDLMAGSGISSGADVAEHYLTNDSELQAAHIVRIDGESDVSVSRTTTPGDQQAIGVVSTQAGVLLGSLDGTTPGITTSITGQEVIGGAARTVPVALSGRVPVKVNEENGIIRKGDPITASSTPGEGMKATKSGRIIGYALENYPSVRMDGTVMVFLSNEYYYNNIFEQALDQVAELTALTDDFANRNYEEATAKLSEFSSSVWNEVAAARLTVSESLHAASGYFQNLTASVITPDESGRLEIALDDFNALTGESQNSELVITNQGEVVTSFDGSGNATFSGKLQTDEVTTNQINARQTNTDYLIASEMESRWLTTDDLNVTGNASIAGELTADSARVNHLAAVESELDQLNAKTATIAGTLYAQRIEANFETNQISDFEQRVRDIVSRERQAEASTTLTDLQADESLQDIIDQLASNQANDQTTGDTSSPTVQTDEFGTIITDADLADSDNSASGSAEPINASDALIAVNQDLDLSTYSGLLSADMALISTSLSVGTEGGTMLAESFLSFKPQTECGLEDSLLCSTFSIQPSGEGRLSLMADALTITRDGGVVINTDLLVAGNLTVTESVQTSQIEPLAGNNLEINLGRTTDSADQTDSTDSTDDNSPNLLADAAGPAELIIRGDNQEEVAAFSASGSARFRQLVIAGDNELEAVAFDGVSITYQSNASAGTATLPAGKTKVIIKSPDVTPNTLVSITPTGSTKNQVLYVQSKTGATNSAETNEANFVVAIDEPVDTDIEFNFWLIQQE